MIENYIPDWNKVCHPVMSQNFKDKLSWLFLVRNPDFRHLTDDQAHVLSSKKVIALADEMTGLDDPFICQNIMKMLCKIMSEESGT
jgi:hypothetical protein